MARNNPNDGDPHSHSWSAERTLRLVQYLDGNVDIRKALVFSTKYKRNKRHVIARKVCFEILDGTKWLKSLVDMKWVRKMESGGYEARKAWIRQHNPVLNRIEWLDQRYQEMCARFGQYTCPEDINQGRDLDYWESLKEGGKKTWFFTYHRWVRENGQARPETADDDRPSSDDTSVGEIDEVREVGEDENEPGPSTRSTPPISGSRKPGDQQDAGRRRNRQPLEAQTPELGLLTDRASSSGSSTAIGTAKKRKTISKDHAIDDSGGGSIIPDGQSPLPVSSTSEKLIKKKKQDKGKGRATERDEELEGDSRVPSRKEMFAKTKKRDKGKRRAIEVSEEESEDTRADREQPPNIRTEETTRDSSSGPSFRNHPQYASTSRASSPGSGDVSAGNSTADSLVKDRRNFETPSYRMSTFTFEDTSRIVKRPKTYHQSAVSTGPLPPKVITAEEHRAMTRDTLSSQPIPRLVKPVANRMIKASISSSRVASTKSTLKKVKSKSTKSAATSSTPQDRLSHFIDLTLDDSDEEIIAVEERSTVRKESLAKLLHRRESTDSSACPSRNSPDNEETSAQGLSSTEIATPRSRSVSAMSIIESSESSGDELDSDSESSIQVVTPISRPSPPRAMPSLFPQSRSARNAEELRKRQLADKEYQKANPKIVDPDSSDEESSPEVEERIDPSGIMVDELESATRVFENTKHAARMNDVHAGTAEAFALTLSPSGPQLDLEPFALSLDNEVYIDTLGDVEMAQPNDLQSRAVSAGPSSASVDIRHAEVDTSLDVEMDMDIIVDNESEGSSPPSQATPGGAEASNFDTQASEFLAAMEAVAGDSRLETSAQALIPTACTAVRCQPQQGPPHPMPPFPPTLHRPCAQTTKFSTSSYQPFTAAPIPAGPSRSTENIIAGINSGLAPVDPNTLGLASTEVSGLTRPRIRSGIVVDHIEILKSLIESSVVEMRANSEFSNCFEHVGFIISDEVEDLRDELEGMIQMSAGYIIDVDRQRRHNVFDRHNETYVVFLSGGTHQRHGIYGRFIDAKHIDIKALIDLRNHKRKEEIANKERRETARKQYRYLPRGRR